MGNLFIRQIIEQVEKGEIRVPEFQRGFVWDSERIAYFLDSIYKGYPFGAVILWKTKEPLRSERKLGPFSLPDPEADYPIKYVLDGQQRITSIFGTFQTSLNPTSDEKWPEIYFDIEADDHIQESRFVVLSEEEVDPSRHFPVSTLFDVTGYRQACANLDDETVVLIDNLQSVFKEAIIPTLEIETEDRGSVAVVFERVNRLGVDLDVLQLLSAWTWNEEFDLRTKFEELAERLDGFGFSGVGEDTNLLLRCTAAVIVGDAAANSLMSMSGEEVRDRFDEIENGIRGAIDFVKTNLNIAKLENLPYPAVLVPLSVYFATTGTVQKRMAPGDLEVIIKWLWRSFFSRRYSAGVQRHLKRDIEEIAKLRDRQSSELADIKFDVTAESFSGKKFNLNSVDTRTFVLMLANSGPRSFISGSKVDLENVLQAYNRAEFHHLMPRQYLRASVDLERFHPNVLANFAMISKSDNNQLGGDAPSVYRSKMPSEGLGDILVGALCPESLFSDDYEKFLLERSNMLVEKAKSLGGVTG